MSSSDVGNSLSNSNSLSNINMATKDQLRTEIRELETRMVDLDSSRKEFVDYIPDIMDMEIFEKEKQYGLGTKTVIGIFKQELLDELEKIEKRYQALIKERRNTEQNYAYLKSLKKKLNAATVLATNASEIRCFNEQCEYVQNAIKM